MSIHHELAGLVHRAGTMVVDSIESFRAACDDYIPEDAATRGEWNLLGDAIRLGEFARFTAQLDLGADPTTALDAHGNRLATERGTQETGGARWALAALGYAVGKVSEDHVLIRHAEMTGGDTKAHSMGSAGAPVVPPGPPPYGQADPTLPSASNAQTQPQLGPSVARGAAVAPEAGATPIPSTRRRGRVVLGAAITALVVVAVTALGVLLTRGDEPGSGGEDPSATAGDRESAERSAKPTSVRPAERSEVLQFAARASEAMFARDYEDYDRQVADAVELMTDSFATEFQATTDDVRGEFVDSRTTVNVRVVGTGVISLDGDVAEALVFANQYVERQGDEATFTPYRLVLTLVRNRGGWLVDELTTDEPDPHPEPDPDQASVLDAARQMVLAFMNLDYRTIAEDTAEVLELATGRFEREYQQASSDLQELTVKARAIQQADIFAAGISQSSEESATVIVATQGTVRNKQTGGEPLDRTYRLKLRLELVDGEWLTSELDYVE